jgi:hypothetical protein
MLNVDEALAVGDAGFQVQCYRRLRDLKERGMAILRVTHDSQTVRLFCDGAVWLDHGRLRMEGRPDEVDNAYLEAPCAGSNSTEQTSKIFERTVAASLPEAPVHIGDEHGLLVGPSTSASRATCPPGPARSLHPPAHGRCLLRDAAARGVRGGRRTVRGVFARLLRG